MGAIDISLQKKVLVIIFADKTNGNGHFQRENIKTINPIINSIQHEVVFYSHKQFEVRLFLE